MTAINPITRAKAERAMLAWAYDAEHAWLVVSLDTESGFPQALNFASQYSYINLMGSNFAGDVYLEEDLDAQAFLMAYDLSADRVAHHQLPDDNAVRTWPTGSASAKAITALL